MGGRLEQAIRLIETAAQCGADAVKLQTVNPDYSYCQGSESYNIFSTLKFDFDLIARLKQVADTLGLTLFTTPGDFPSLHLALKIGFEIIKISSWPDNEPSTCARCGGIRTFNYSLYRNDILR